jgi:hypothetical protein
MGRYFKHLPPALRKKQTANQTRTPVLLHAEVITFYAPKRRAESKKQIQKIEPDKAKSGRQRILQKNVAEDDEDQGKLASCELEGKVACGEGPGTR